MRRHEAREALQFMKVKVDKRGRFVIPGGFRKANGLKAGDEVLMTCKDGELRIRKGSPPDRTKRTKR